MTWWKGDKRVSTRLAALLLTLTAQASLAGPLGERLQERRALQAQNEAQDSVRSDTLGDDAGSAPAAALPAGVNRMRDISYGDDPRQRFDVYRPAQSGLHGAPVIFMVHGGAWMLGDKAARGVVDNKVARWVSKGVILISVNYRMVPQADPLQQAQDVARALAAAQDKAAGFGGDRGKFILMGHSAGAHLVALISSSPSLTAGLGITPWLGSVLLDSAALDVPHIMEAKHARLYDRAFGREPAYWRSVSPLHALQQAAPPMLAVCSSQRTDSCQTSARFVAQAESLGARATVLQQDLSHKDINQRLGELPGYTAAVESFLGSLDASLAAALRH